jgi:hypothetical protein
LQIQSGRTFYLNSFFYQETLKEKEKIKQSLNRPLEWRQRQELQARAELDIMTGADIILSTLSSSLSQVRKESVGNL